MANPIKASDLIIDDGAIKALTEQLKGLEAQIDAINTRSATLEKETRKFNASQSTQRDRIAESAKEADKLEKEYRKYEEALKDTNTKIQALRDGTRQLNLVAKLEAKLAASKEGSYNRLSAQYSLNKIRLNQLSKAERENTAEGRRLVKTSNDIYQEMKRLQAETGKTSLNVGNYKESVKDALSEIRPFGINIRGIIDSLGRKRAALSGVTTALGGTSKALRILKIALISTGIGAILILLGSLFAALTKTQQGIDKVNRVLSAFKAIGDVFIDRLAAIGTALTTDFIGTIKAAGSAVGSFFTKLITFDYAGVIADIGAVAAATKNLADEIKEEAAAAFSITAALQGIRNETQKLETRTEQTRASIKRLNLVAEDTSKAITERAAAAGKAGALERELLEERKRLLERELALLERQKALGNSLFEDDQELADKRQEIARIERESLELQTTIQNKLNTINREGTAIEKELNKELEEAAATLGGPVARAQLEYRRELERINELREKAAKIGFEQDFGELSLLAEARLNRALAAINLSLSPLSTSLEKSAAEAKKLGKEFQQSVQPIDKANDGLKKTGDEIIKLIEAREKARSEAGRERTIFDVLGFHPDDLREGLKSSFDFAKEQFQAFADERRVITDQIVQNADREVQAAQNSLNTQLQLQAQGVANTAQTAKEELRIAQENQREALRQQEKAAAAQRRAQSIQQASNLITASSKIWAQLGFPFAIPAIGFLWGSFISAKVRAKKLAADEFSEGVYERLSGGSHQSGNDISLGIRPNGRERRAQGGEAMAVFSKKRVRQYGAQLPAIVDAINRGVFQLKYSKINDGGGGLTFASVEKTDTSRMESELTQIRRQGEKEITHDGKGRKIVKYKNLTQTYV